MTDLPWPESPLRSVEDYRSLDDLRRYQSLFGTDRPVSWVTGSGSNRVGRAIAKRFAARGYRIVLHVNESLAEGERIEKIWNQAGVETMLVDGSIDEESKIDGWMEQIFDRFGRLDVLVHAAAVWEPSPLESTSSQFVLDQIRVNSLGSFLCGQRAGLKMSKQSTGGAIIFLGDWSIQRPYRDFAAYFTSKGCIPALTRSLAVELAERNSKVRVNAIMPGPVLLADGIPDATQQAILRQSLLQRAGTADDIARAAVFLAEQEFITGICIPVDGGRSIYAGPTDDAIAHQSRFNS